MLGLFNPAFVGAVAEQAGPVPAEPSLTITTAGDAAIAEVFSITGGTSEIVEATDGSDTATATFDGDSLVSDVTNNASQYNSAGIGTATATFTAVSPGAKDDYAKSSGGGGSVSVDVQGAEATSEVTILDLDGATSGYVRISGSDPIAWDADAAAIETILDALRAVTVTGSGPFTITEDAAGVVDHWTISENALLK